MKPTQIVSDWINSLEPEIRRELLDLAGFFHVNEEIALAYDPEEKLDKFLGYLSTDGLTSKEVVQRTFMVIKLIDFGFDGRDTEEGWTKSLDRNLDIRNRMKDSEGPTEIVDNFLSNYHERKNAWIELANDWKRLTENELSNQRIADWFFQNMKL